MAKPRIVEIKKRILNSQTELHLASATLDGVDMLNGSRFFNPKLDYNENAIIAEVNSQYSLADVLRLAHQRAKIISHLEAQSNTEVRP